MPPKAAVDAIVVGAGPAGSTTALLLARAGHEVVLLDRQTFPRPKPCGDCLSPEATRVLDRLALLESVEAEQPARLEGWRIFSPGGWSFFGGFAGASAGDPGVATAIALPRERLDRRLVEGARGEGAVLLTPFHAIDLLRDRGDRVTGVRGRGPDGAPMELRARCVIGADGLRSVVARRLGLLRRAPRLRKVSLTAHLRGVTGLGAIGEMHLIAGACAGFAPVGAPDRGGAPANVTLVVEADRFGREVAGGADRFFRAMLRRFPRLAGRLDAAAPAGRLLASGPFDSPTRDVVVDGAALVGDAAGYYDPFTGQGIYQALAGAEILAEEIDAALRAGDVSALRLRRYARRRAALLRGARRLQRAIESVLSRPVVADAVIRRLARVPAAAEALIAATGDLRPARTLLSPGLILALLFAPTLPEVSR